MLVLSRQRDETIMIGDEIEITVVDIRGDKVRLGITAPTRIAVHRKEVYESIKRENEQASRLGGTDLGSLSAISPGPAKSGARDKAARLAAPTRIPATLSPGITPTVTPEVRTPLPRPGAAAKFA
jgi:carbon storage regulator